MNAGGRPVSTRQHYIDNLRNLAVLALVLFHTARLFDSEPWHIKNGRTFAAADWLVGFFNPWHMPLLFLLAGMSAVLALRTRSAGGFIGERFHRLLVPFLAGIALTVLPQVYLERISYYVPDRQSPVDLHGVGFLAFIPRFFRMAAYPAGDFSWHHLWFFIYLFIYSIVLAPALLWFARSPRAARLGAWFAPGGRPFLLLVPMAAAELWLRPAFPSTNALIDDWANHANYVSALLLGALVAAAPLLVLACERLRWPALALAVLLMLAWLARPSWSGWLPGGFRHWAPGLRAVVEWLWIVALLGLARAGLDRRIPFLSAFTRYALPFYVIHQLVIVWLGWLTFGWSGLPLLKYGVIAVAAFCISYGLARLVDLTAVTRFLAGMKSPRPSPPAPARPSPVRPAAL